MDVKAVGDEGVEPLGGHAVVQGAGTSAELETEVLTPVTVKGIPTCRTQILAKFMTSCGNHNLNPLIGFFKTEVLSRYQTEACPRRGILAPSFNSWN